MSDHFYTLVILQMSRGNQALNFISFLHLYLDQFLAFHLLGKCVREGGFGMQQYFILAGCRTILPFILTKMVCYPSFQKSIRHL